MQDPSGFVDPAATNYNYAKTSRDPRRLPFPPATPAEPIQLTSKLVEESTMPLIGAQLQAEGFTHVEKDALEFLERSILQMVQELLVQAKERAESEGRICLNVVDLWETIEEEGAVNGGVDALGEMVKAQRGRRHIGVKLLPEEPQHAEAGLDIFEDGGVPTKLPYAPNHMPALPPKHTYMFSVPPPTKKATSLSSLNQRVEEARLAEKSLRGLIRALDGNEQVEFAAGPGDVDVPYVNWERTRMQGRKSWNIKGK